MTRPDPTPHLLVAALALREASSPAAGFAALQSALQAALGFGLFSVMAHDADTGWNRRVHSSDPARWPVGGGKPSVGRPWAVQVIQQGMPWTGSGEAAMRWAYPDHNLVMGAGLGSGLNLPVRYAGRTLGVLNLLHAEGFYTSADFPTGLLFAGLAVPLFTA